MSSCDRRPSRQQMRKALKMATSFGSRSNKASAAVLVAVSAGLLASCASAPQKSASSKKRSKEYFAESIYGVKASPRVSTRRTKLPRGGGRDQVGKPYQVKGKWYFPKEDKNYRKVGAASWYGDAFHGRLTANGEIYDMTHLTAAHPTMPLPSYARVTNLANGNSVIVRVNDRGPYDSGRVIDLSHRAADLLGYTQKGTAKVEVEYVGRARMDGQDDQYLVASYRPGSRVPDPSADGLPDGVMIAMNGNSPSRSSNNTHAAQQPRGPRTKVFFGEMQLPSEVPPAPEQPAGGEGSQTAFATMSYAPQSVTASLDPFTSFNRSDDLLTTNVRDGSFIAAGTFADRASAEALKNRLAAFGDARVEAGGRGSQKGFSVTLRQDGRIEGDALLQAAWANGAPDAMTIRE